MNYFFEKDRTIYDISLSNKEVKNMKIKDREVSVSLFKIHRKPTFRDIGSATLDVVYHDDDSRVLVEAIIAKRTKENERRRIGERIKELRNEKKWTKERLANEAGLHDTHITRIENGDYDVRIDTLARIADALGYEINITNK